MKDCKEYKEEDFLQLSGIQHFVFCKRQWALIHIENQWEENIRTVEGKLLHENAHNNEIKESRGNKFISRAMPVFSRTLGTNGECDIVEFVKDENGVSINGKADKYKLYPVEYKRGKPKNGNEDIVQLAAQAICLEEMFCCDVDKGYIYYGETRHRTLIDIDKKTKEMVKNCFDEMHNLYERHFTPKVRWSKSCKACSLNNVCLPIIGKNKSAKEYIAKTLSGGD